MGWFSCTCAICSTNNSKSESKLIHVGGDYYLCKSCYTKYLEIIHYGWFGNRDITRKILSNGKPFNCSFCNSQMKGQGWNYVTDDNGAILYYLCSICNEKLKLTNPNHPYPDTKEEAEKIIKTATAGEARKKCKACGYIFCYTTADLQRNQQLAAKANKLSADAGLSNLCLDGQQAQLQEMQAAELRKQIIDYTKCPRCHSSDLTDAGNETNEALPDSKPAQNETSPIEELKKYKELFDAGVITQEEFDFKKKQLLGM